MSVFEITFTALFASLFACTYPQNLYSLINSSLSVGKFNFISDSVPKREFNFKLSYNIIKFLMVILTKSKLNSHLQDLLILLQKVEFTTPCNLSVTPYRIMHNALSHWLSAY